MPFPSAVNTVQAPAVAGDFSDHNPRVSVAAGPGGFVAGQAGVSVGLFAWADAAGIVVNNFGSGAPTGVTARVQQALITAFLAEASQLIPAGLGLTLFSACGIWVKSAGAGAVAVGMKAYANFATGAVTFAATGTPPTAASVTGSVAANVVTGAIAVNNVTASIAGQVMTVSAVGAGAVLAAGQALTGANVATGTSILAQLTGTAGGTGTYTVSVSQTAASAAVVASGGGLTVSAVTTGTLAIGQTISGSGITAGTTITALGTGTGGAGTYAVSISQTAASTAVTGSGGTLTVTAVGSGAIALFDPIIGTNVTAGSFVNGNAATNVGLTGAGGAGTYLVSASSTAASTAIVVVAGVETKFIALSAGAPGELVKMSSHLLG